MRRKQHFFLLAVFVVTCWLSVSCNNPTNDPCDNDDDCTWSYVCHESTGKCVECDEDQNCPDNKTCVDFACAPECVDTEGCSLGQRCKEGACTIGCAEDTDCPFPHICRLSQCTIQFKCESDSNCRHGATCDLSDTPSRCVNTACTSDAECAASQRCYTHDKCWPRICETDADCPAATGFNCIKNRCVCTGTCS
jgi:hypothetical protein